MYIGNKFKTVGGGGGGFKIERHKGVFGFFSMKTRRLGRHSPKETVNYRSLFINRSNKKPLRT